MALELRAKALDSSVANTEVALVERRLVSALDVASDAALSFEYSLFI